MREVPTCSDHCFVEVDLQTSSKSEQGSLMEETFQTSWLQDLMNLPDSAAHDGIPLTKEPGEQLALNCSELHSSLQKSRPRSHDRDCRFKTYLAGLCQEEGCDCTTYHVTDLPPAEVEHLPHEPSSPCPGKPD